MTDMHQTEETRGPEPVLTAWNVIGTIAGGVIFALLAFAWISGTADMGAIR